jgi:hypothetical protein
MNASARWTALKQPARNWSIFHRKIVTIGWTAQVASAKSNGPFAREMPQPCVDLFGNAASLSRERRREAASLA